MCIRIVRIDRQRLIDSAERLRELAPGGERQTPVASGLDEAGLDPHRFGVVDQCLVRMVQFGEDKPPVVVRIGVIGLTATAPAHNLRPLPPVVPGRAARLPGCNGTRRLSNRRRSRDGAM